MHRCGAEGHAVHSLLTPCRKAVPQPHGPLAGFLPHGPRETVPCLAGVAFVASGPNAELVERNRHRLVPVALQLFDELESTFADLSVLSYSEVPSRIEIQSAAVVPALE